MICVVSDEQRKEILGKMSKILRAMKTCSSIKEVEEQTGIPSSTIQRYLGREDYFRELAGAGLLSPNNVPKALEFTRDWLQTSKQAGNRRGGKTSQERHGYQKTNDGKFNGHTK